MPDPEQSSPDKELAQDYYQPSDYMAANFDDNGNLTINNVPIAVWLRHNSDALYGVSKAKNLNSLEAAATILFDKKREEALWAKFWLSDTIEPQEISEALPRFAKWIAESQPFDGGWSSSTGFVKATRMTRPILRSLSRAISQDPAVLDTAVEFYIHLNSLPKEVGEDTYATPPTKFVKETVETLEVIGCKKYSDTNLIPDVEGLVQLADRLTDEGIILEGFWYRIGVRKLNGPPNFAFMETLHRRMLKSGDQQKGMYARHPLYYLDACRLTEAVMEAAAEDPSRNRQVVEVINTLLQKAKQKEGHILPAQIISVANVITKLIDYPTDTESADDSRIFLEPIEPALQAIPLAFARMLYASKLGVVKNEDTDYKDSVYIDMMNQIINKATKMHESWFEQRVQQRTTDLKILFPSATKAQLEEIALRRGKVSMSLWKKWKPGYGLLS